MYSTMQGNCLVPPRSRKIVYQTIVKVFLNISAEVTVVLGHHGTSRTTCRRQRPGCAMSRNLRLARICQ